jgi:hypothetical protein
MNNNIQPGQIYIPKKGMVSYALIMDHVKEDGSFGYRTSDCKNTKNQFNPVLAHYTQEEFLEKYKLASSEDLTGIIESLEENAEVIAKKLELLKK